MKARNMVKKHVNKSRLPHCISRMICIAHFRYKLRMLSFLLVTFVGLLLLKMIISIPSPPADNSMFAIPNFEFSTNVSNPNHPCSTQSVWSFSKVLIIVVHSDRSNFEPRERIRETYGSWRKFANWNVPVVFLLGIAPPGEHPSIAFKLKNEVANYSDIVIGNFVDNYGNSSYKHMMGYKWALENCSYAKYYLKTDDNVLVNIFHAVNLIYWMETLEYINNAITQYFYCSMSSREVPLRAFNPRWSQTEVRHMEEELTNVVNWDEYDTIRYPYYCANGIYLTKMSVVQRMYAVRNKVPFFWIGDIFVTGVIREYINKLDSRWHNVINLLSAKIYNYEGQDEDAGSVPIGTRLLGVHIENGQNKAMETFWQKFIVAHSNYDVMQ